MKIGVMADSFRKENFALGLAAAKAVGADGIQIYADEKIKSCDKPALKEMRRMAEDDGLVFSAVCGDFGCDMYYNGDRALIDAEKRIMESAKILGADVVTTHIGVVTEERDDRYESILSVCRELSAFAESAGGKFAVETGPEKARLLKRFLDEAGNGISVNFDPANLIMCARDDVLEAVRILGDKIVHTHAKDGVNLKPFDTRALYAPGYYGLTPIGKNYPEYFCETPLGKGGVDWTEYINALKAVGYDGFLTVERECGDDPAKDIGDAVVFLRSII